MEPIRVKYHKTLQVGTNPVTRVPAIGTISGTGDLVYFATAANGVTTAIVKCDGSGKFHECQLDDLIAIDYDIKTEGF